MIENYMQVCTFAGFEGKVDFGESSLHQLWSFCRMGMLLCLVFFVWAALSC